METIRVFEFVSNGAPGEGEIIEKTVPIAGEGGLSIHTIIPFAQAGAFIGSQLSPLARALERADQDAVFIQSDVRGHPGVIRKNLIPKGQNIKPVSTTL